jgi:hypothetical protein
MNNEQGTMNGETTKSNARSNDVESVDRESRLAVGSGEWMAALAREGYQSATARGGRNFDLF